METIKGRALVLRTCTKDMTSRNGFKWPVSGPVECPDWVASDDCGNGLHGALLGEGDGSLFHWDADAVWQVVEIKEWVDLRGKVKFPRGIVVHTGDRKSATDYIRDNGATGAVIGSIVSAGDHGTATAGYGGTATAGDHGTATAGYGGTIQIRHWDGRRYRIKTGYVGEDGIEADVAYRMNAKGEFVKA